MTDETPTDNDELPPSRRSDGSLSRRTYLRSMALAPTPVVLLKTNGTRDRDSSPLVTRSTFPDGFARLDIDQPTPFARRLMDRDDRFREDHFSVRGFGETPDGANPRYIVNTGAIDLPTPNSASVIREQVTGMFEEYMDRLYDRSGVDWTQLAVSGFETAAVDRHAAIRFDTLATAQVNWLQPQQSAQCVEHWVLDVTDTQAVLTLVFGLRQGPWKPRELLERTRIQVRRRLHG